MNRRGAEAQRVNEITEKVIGFCIEIHKQLGPGLLESAYEACLCLMLDKANMTFRRQVRLPVEFEGIRVDTGYRLDLLVEELVVVELKAVEKLLPVHDAQLLTYLKLAGMPAGLLINFNVALLKQGIRRMVNHLKEHSAPPRLRGSTGTSDTVDGGELHRVKSVIPHREPFLFVDRIVEQAEGRIVTEREVRADEPQFAGHYPGSPLMPGVLLCEACFQTGAMLLGSTDEVPTSRKPVLTRILEAKFRGMVVPGDLLSVIVEQEEKLGEAFVMNGKVSVADKNVLRVKFIVAMIEVGK